MSFSILSSIILKVSILRALQLNLSPETVKQSSSSRSVPNFILEGHCNLWPQSFKLPTCSEAKVSLWQCKFNPALCQWYQLHVHLPPLEVGDATTRSCTCIDDIMLCSLSMNSTLTKFEVTWFNHSSKLLLLLPLYFPHPLLLTSWESCLSSPLFLNCHIATISQMYLCHLRRMQELCSTLNPA